MRKFKHYALLLIVALAMFGCGDDYDDTALKNDISDLKSRVEKLESWCSTANTQISALQGLVSALQENDYVTGVTPIMEGAKEVGYTITFAKSKPITILNGKDGENGTDGITPIISVKQDTDGQYYWTVTTGEAAPVWMTDAEGKKINAAGQAGEAGHTPVISVETSDGKLCWKVDGKWLLDEKGNKVPATGEKGATGATGATGSTGSKGDQGDSIFKEGGIDYDENKDYVIFTLTDGTEIKLMRALDVTIGIKGVEDEMFITSAEQTTGKTAELTLPASADDYKAITAEIKSKQGTDTDIATRATTAEPWKVKLIKPVLEDDKVKTPGKVIITPSSDVKTGDKAILTLSIIDKQNIEHTTVIIITYTDQIPVSSVTLDKTTLALEVGGSETLTATVLPADAQEKTVTWSSSDEAIAKVSSTGEVEGVKAGTATITATTTDGNKTAICTVTVSNVAVTGVSFASATASVAIGATTTLTPVFTPTNAADKTGTWMSSNTGVATVNNGVVTGVGAGTATITFTSTDGGFNATCTVTVNAAAADYDWYRNPTNAQAGIYTIATKAELIEFAKLVNKDATLPADLKENGDQFAGKTVLLGAPIDLGKEEWTPIGKQYATRFQGTFDGQNREISNLSITTGTGSVGLFGYFGGTVKSLTVSGEISASGNQSTNAGGIVGQIYSGKVIACINKAKIKVDDALGYAGGIAGKMTGSSTKPSAIIACENYGDVTSNAQDAGGIVGSVDKSKIVLACINHGNVSGNTGSNAGGVIGYINAVPAYSCISEGTVAGGTGSIGGVIGGTNFSYTSFPAFYFHSTTSTLTVEGAAHFDWSKNTFSEYTDLNSSTTINALNSEITTWNAANADWLCPFKFEAVTGNYLPKLVPVQ